MNKMLDRFHSYNILKLVMYERNSYTHQPQPDRDSSLPATEAQPKDLLAVKRCRDAQCPMPNNKGEPAIE
ncbi:hypothetical protein NIES4075_44430 [Tolypothrix sp. NIES-4075]|nr:hypothetical protein NIES4075_44430 [Tolypothrix sp. NIES-4075]